MPQQHVIQQTTTCRPRGGMEKCQGWVWVWVHVMIVMLGVWGRMHGGEEFMQVCVTEDLATSLGERRGRVLQMGAACTTVTVHLL
jgi:hypothetical protein